MFGEDKPDGVPYLGRTLSEGLARVRNAYDSENQKAQPSVDEIQAKIEIIYGLLWCMEIDTSTVTGMAASLARKTALDMIDKDGQRRGIEIAQRAVRGKMLQAIPAHWDIDPRAG